VVENNKPVLNIDWATHEAAKYACENWHYSQRMPKSKLVKFGVWENNKFIGVVIFGSGATPDLVNPYNLKPNQGCELVRIALTKHITPVSKIMSFTLKKLKKEYPNLRIVISFADPSEGHHGGVYQATNWVYNGKTTGYWGYIDKNGKEWHPRNVWVNKKGTSKVIHASQCEKVYKEGKHRYLYPLDDEMKKQIMFLKKPYPKRVSGADNGTAGVHLAGGGVIPTDTLQTQEAIT